MMFKPMAMVLVLAVSLSAWAQRDVEALDWKEGVVPPPPAFDTGKLLTFDVLASSSLVFGVDPATLSISDDGVVRYVMVAANPDGARNVMYEGIHCATGEFKTYARYTAEGVWKNVEKPEWRLMFGNMPSRHALQFAKAGACDSAAPPLTVLEIVRRLKFGRSNW